MKKKQKIILIVAICATAVIAAVVALALNYHKIYVYAQTKGWFRQDVAIEERKADEFRAYTIEELEGDSRVKFDQSMMLVNKEHFLPEGFVPDILEYKDTKVYMSSCMIDAYARLSAAVKENTGNKLYVSSDFRTSEEQEALYQEDPITATIPGASEHQTGLALDVYVAYYAGDGFVKSRSGRFVNSHAHEYGFIIRYPSYGEDITGIRFEPWHIRYVGHPHSDVIYNNHITLEEYIDGLKIGQWYEIGEYLVCRQNLTDAGFVLPDGFESCTISPDNTGSYVLTVKIPLPLKCG